MARSRSPAPRRAASRSKSPAPKKAAKSSSPLDDENVQLGVSLVVLLGLQTLANGFNPDPKAFLGNFFNAQAGDFSISPLPFSILLTLHVLNKCQGASSGFWAQSFVGAVIASFSPIIVSDIINGNKQSILADEGLATLAFVCWYFCNHDIPFTGINLWTTIKGSGKCVQPLLDLASLTFTTNAVITAVGTSSAAGPFGFSVFTPCAVAVAVGASSDFFPLSKGLSVKNTSATYNALAIAIYTITLPLLTARVAPLATVVDMAGGLVGGHTVLAAVTLYHLFGRFIPFPNPVGTVAGIAQKLTGL